MALTDCETVFKVNLFVCEGVWRAIRLNEQANRTKNGASRIQSNLFELLRHSLFYIKRDRKMTKRKNTDIIKLYGGNLHNRPKFVVETKNMIVYEDKRPL